MAAAGGRPQSAIVEPPPTSTLVKCVLQHLSLGDLGGGRAGGRTVADLGEGEGRGVGV